MALGTKLKNILAERGITVKDFAKQIGVPPTTLYSFIQRDSEDVKLELITKICTGLGIKVTDFLQTLDYIDGKPTTIFDLTDFDEKEIIKVVNGKIMKEINESKPNITAISFKGDDFTEEELEEIKKYAEFIKSKRIDWEKLGKTMKSLSNTLKEDSDQD